MVKRERESAQELKIGPLILTEEAAQDYLRAVEDDSSIYSELGVVPSTAIAAHVLQGLLSGLGLPAGTIHASQELECERPGKVGEPLRCQVKLSRPIRRGGWTYIAASFSVVDREDKGILKGRTTVLVPSPVSPA